MKGPLPYGSGWRRRSPAVGVIWDTQLVEPEPCEPYGMRSLLVIEDDQDKASVLAKEVLEIAGKVLVLRHASVFQMRYCLDMTIREIADALEVTPARVQQIESVAIRKVRLAMCLGRKEAEA